MFRADPAAPVATSALEEVVGPFVSDLGRGVDRYDPFDGKP